MVLILQRYSEVPKIHNVIDTMQRVKLRDDNDNAKSNMLSRIFQRLDFFAEIQDYFWDSEDVLPS